MYVEGDAVVYRKNLHCVVPGAPSISIFGPVSPKVALLTSEILERFIFLEGGSLVVPKRIWKKRISRSWCSDAKKMSKIGSALMMQFTL